MRIGIDCAMLFDIKGDIQGGIGYYLDNLIQALCMQKKEDTFVLFFHNAQFTERYRAYENVEIVIWPHQNLRKIPFVHRHIVQALFAEKQNLDVMHWPAHTMPLLYGGASIITVHDLAIVHNPDWFPRKPLYHKFFMPASFKKAHRIIAVSESTKKDIVYFYGVPEHKISMVYEGVNDGGVTSQRCESTQEKLEIDNPFVFFVGTIEPRKNLVNQMKAFELLHANVDIQKQYPELQFIMAGGKGWQDEAIYEYYHQSTYKDRMHFVGRISDAEKIKYLQQAQLLLYPSWYEGFGLPILEAMHAGVPVVSSNRGAMEEIGGTAMAAVDPSQPQDIATMMTKIMLDHQFKHDLIARGLARFKKFSWEQAATETYSAYQKTAS